MEIIGKDEILSFTSRGVLETMTCMAVRKSGGLKVRSFMDLATRIAALQYSNPAHVLLFRGQSHDHKRGAIGRPLFTSLSPSMFRGSDSGAPDANELMRRFQNLEQFEKLLVRRYRNAGFQDIDRLERHRILRWSILQHYEVCPTPLLDVSHSLRIAVSFACDTAQKEAFLFVLGVPNISGAITASAETGLQIIRLSSVCPPDAIRPHIQEGYLLGEYPEMGAYDQKALYAHYEIDFGRRLIAKFRFSPNDFRNDPDFPIVRRQALYPDAEDPLYKLAKSLSH